MSKEENIVSYTWDEIKAHLAENKPDLTRFHALTDEEIEANAASDPDDPTNEPGFYENSTLVYPKPARRKLTVEVDESLLNFIESHQLNVSHSINAALKNYVEHFSK